ncbi:hypothetical protein XENOCAPTIV_025176 [Xenoophorus captivus]|uniref:Uncharacterized protein n=1 Tax=Xenoophorus captivus TaxID=1517983 RepID=A0ABV0QEE4_9TELE
MYRHAYKLCKGAISSAFGIHCSKNEHGSGSSAPSGRPTILRLFSLDLVSMSIAFSSNILFLPFKFSTSSCSSLTVDTHTSTCVILSMLSASSFFVFSSVAKILSSWVEKSVFKFFIAIRISSFWCG